MGSSGGVKYKTPTMAKEAVGEANTILQGEQERLAGLQQAISSNSGYVRNALGLSDTGDTWVNMMIGDLLGGGEIDESKYQGLLRGGAYAGGPPTAVAAPQGKRPTEYRKVFNGKSWGKNDQKKQDASIAAIKAWDAQNAKYQDYQTQKAAYDKAANGPVDRSAFERAKATALMYKDQIDQARGSWGNQLQTEQDLLSQLNAAVQRAPEASQPYRDQLAGFQDQLSRMQSGGWENQALLDRATQQLGALQAGDWSAPGTTLRDLDAAQATMQQKMFNQMGSGWATSSAGLEAQQRFNEGRAGLLDQLYQSDLNQTQQRWADLTNQRTNAINSALGNVNLAQQNLGAGEADYLQMIQGLLGTYQSSAGQRNATLNNLIGSQSALNGYNNEIASMLDAYNNRDYSTSLMPLVQGYQGNAAALGQSTSAVQQSNPWGAVASGAGTVIGGMAGALLGGWGAAPGAMLGGMAGRAIAGGAGAGGGAGGSMYYSG